MPAKSNHALVDNHDIFFFNDTATTEIYTLSLHDALPISVICPLYSLTRRLPTLLLLTTLIVSALRLVALGDSCRGDRKSTRLNSSHANISYAVFCLKKKNSIMTLTFSLLLLNRSLAAPTL